MKTKCLLLPSHFIFFPGLLSLLHSQFIYLFLHPKWHGGRGNGGSGQPRTALLLLPPHSFSCSSMGPSQGCSLSWNSTCPGVMSVGCRGMTCSTMVFPSVFRHFSPCVSLTSVSQGCFSRFFLYSSLLCSVLRLLTVDSLFKTRGCFRVGVKIPFLDTGNILSSCCRILSQCAGALQHPSPCARSSGHCLGCPSRHYRVGFVGRGHHCRQIETKLQPKNLFEIFAVWSN